MIKYTNVHKLMNTCKTLNKQKQICMVKYHVRKEDFVNLTDLIIKQEE